MKVKVIEKDKLQPEKPVQLGTSPQEQEKHHSLLRKLSKFDREKKKSIGRSTSSNSLLGKKVTRCDVGGTSLAVHSEAEMVKASRKTSFHARSNHKFECEPVQRPGKRSLPYAAPPRARNQAFRLFSSLVILKAAEG